MPTVITTTNGTHAMHRRRTPDIFDRLFGSVLVGAFLVSALVVVAVGVGAVWLIVVAVQDLVRRFS